MARSPQEQYDALDSLIAQLEARLDQSYGVRGKQLVLKQLQPLYAERQRLMRTVAESATGSMMATICQIDRPS